MTVTDPTHVATAKVLREQFQLPRSIAAAGDELGRDLADYDRAFGFIDTVPDGAASDGEVA